VAVGTFKMTIFSEVKVQATMRRGGDGMVPAPREEGSRRGGELVGAARRNMASQRGGGGLMPG
jgi:hypothetical protein